MEFPPTGLIFYQITKNNPLRFKNTNYDYECVIFCPISKLQYVDQRNNLIALINGHKNDFQHHAAGKLNKMDKKLLYDRIIHHNRLLPGVHCRLYPCMQQ